MIHLVCLLVHVSFSRAALGGAGGGAALSRMRVFDVKGTAMTAFSIMG
jgi:hypothetical protein